MGNAPRKNKRCGYCRTAQKHCKCMPVKAVDSTVALIYPHGVSIPVMRKEK